NAGSGSGVLSQIIGAASDFIQSRWGQQRGTITIDPVTGQIVQKQHADYPIQTQAPIVASGQLGAQSTEGFGTGIATGTLLMVGVGFVALMMMTRGGRR